MFYKVNKDLPELSSLADFSPPAPSKIYTQEGTLFSSYGHENRKVVSIKKIPKNVINAFLAAEDSDFYTHPGINVMGILRAFWANLKTGKFVQGGSTITQQVAKSFLLSNEKTILRKIKDILLAIKIEQTFSKEEILYLYLNKVYFGGGHYGVYAAAEGYFKKTLKDLAIHETALIAGLLVAPDKYSPYKNPQFSLIRQRYVLKRMLETKMISEQEYEESIKTPLKIYKKPKGLLFGGHISELIRLEAIKHFGEENFNSKGLSFHTTIDGTLQKRAEAALAKGLEDIDKRQGLLGPLKKISLTEIPEWDLKLREKIQDHSVDFILIHSEEKISSYKEQEKGEIEINTLERPTWTPETITIEYKTKKKQKTTSLSASILKGISSDQLEQQKNFLDLLELDKKIEVPVLFVNDDLKMVFFSLGGLPGVIPYEGLQWAKPRFLSSDRYNTKSYSKISDFLSPGNVITIKLENLKFQLPFENSLYYLKAQLDQTPVVQGAIVAIDPHSGEIKALVGGNNFFENQFNRATMAMRQPGSAFKPFVFALGLESGYTPNTVIYDTPESLGAQININKTWRPKNYDGEFLGPVTFRKALEQSRNIPTVKIAEQLGVSSLLEFCKRLGLKGNFPEDLSLSLGSASLSPLSLTLGMAPFANGGKRVFPKLLTSIKDKKNKPVTIFPLEGIGESKQNEQENTQVYGERLSFLMSYLLSGVIQYGTAASAAKDIGPYYSGKTGTTSDYIDAWFIGYNSNLILGVWVGMDDNSTMGYGETGGKAALPIWTNIMKSMANKYPATPPNPPEGVVFHLIDKNTGKLLNGPQSSTSSPAHPFREAFVSSEFSNTLPNNSSPTSSTSEGQEQKPLFEDEYYQ